MVVNHGAVTSHTELDLHKTSLSVNTTGDALIQHRMVVNHDVVTSHTELDLHKTSLPVKSTGDALIQHRMVVNHGAVTSHTELDLHQVPLLNEQGRVVAGYAYYMSLAFANSAAWKQTEIFSFINTKGLSMEASAHAARVP